MELLPFSSPNGTTSTDEYGDNMPSGCLAGATNIQALIGLEQLRELDQNVCHRQMLTNFFFEQLPMLGANITPLKAGSEKAILWAIPLLMENKRNILMRAVRTGLPIITWFDHLQAHIDPATSSRYNYRPGQYPLSERMFSREIHLLTAPWLTLEQADKTIQLLKQHVRLAY